LFDGRRDALAKVAFDDDAFEGRAEDGLGDATLNEIEAGFGLFGLGLGEEAQPIDQVDLDLPLGLVIGNEGDGLRRLVRDRCDGLLKLPMYGQVESLNAAVAGSIALFAARAARRAGVTDVQCAVVADLDVQRGKRREPRLDRRDQRHRDGSVTCFARKKPCASANRRNRPMPPQTLKSTQISVG